MNHLNFLFGVILRGSSLVFDTRWHFPGEGEHASRRVQGGRDGPEPSLHRCPRHCHLLRRGSYQKRGTWEPVTFREHAMDGWQEKKMFYPLTGCSQEREHRFFSWSPCCRGNVRTLQSGYVFWRWSTWNQSLYTNVSWANHQKFYSL